ncbi:cell division protein FtsA [Pseudothermotoga elfii]
MIFALDVGTRKVAGLIGYFQDDILNVVDFDVVEHSTRSMLDGQIHDIKNVAKTIEIVRDLLERRNEIELKEVAVAVAGRFLKTVVVENEIEIPNKTIDEEIIRQLESGAVAKAPVSDETGTELHCVGYSVMEYRLDDFWIKNPTGHKGRKLYVRAVVALLPVQVVDAMISALHKAGLKPSFLTLEPMAALQISVPEDIRLINIALIDVGAGTSDIAISKAGTIVGYDMVPMAGDEITEAIAQHYLLDFLTAEQVKRRIDKQKTIEAVDVTGRKISIDRSSILDVVNPVVETISKSIAERIEKLNLGKPSVVFLVGGGAKLSVFRKKLSEALNLPEEYITLKTVENLNCIKSTKDNFTGSEYVTLAGIAYSSVSASGSIYDVVKINGEKVRLLKLGQTQTILQILTQKGFKLSELLGKPLPALVFELNGETRVIPGKIIGGKKIILNGSEAAFHQTVRNGDEIEILAKPEEEVYTPKILDFVKEINIEINGKDFMKIYPQVLVNEKLMEDLNYQILDGDKIVVKDINIDEIRKIVEEKIGYVSYTLNNETRSVKKMVLNLVNFVENDKEQRYIFEGRKVKIDDILHKQDKIFEIIFNGKTIKLKPKNDAVKVNGEYTSRDKELQDGMQIEQIYWQPIVADALAEIQLNIDEFKDYKIFLNGKPASFVDELKDGDEIKFEIIKKVQSNQP